MPVRFQVDPDFYDHPKSIGLSDAAVALWVRAGSYSAAKLTDGFIAEHVLPTLSRTPDEAADELRRRGLWRRVKGGFRFHQWEERNLTRARVEGDRASDRKRKASARAAARRASVQASAAQGQNAKQQVNPETVRPESNRNPPGIQPESNRNPPVSVSVSVSESVSGSGRPSAPPPKCPTHIDDPDPPPCGRCAEARRTREAWDVAQAAAIRQQRAELARQRAEANQLAIAACTMCDQTGQIPGVGACSHDPTVASRATRHAAAAREHLAQLAAARRPGSHRTDTDRSTT